MMNIRCDIKPEQNKEYVNAYTSLYRRFLFLVSGLFFIYLCYFLVPSFIYIVSALFSLIQNPEQAPEIVQLFRDNPLFLFVTILSLLIGTPIGVWMIYYAIKSIISAFAPSYSDRGFYSQSPEHYTDLNYSFQDDVIIVRKTSGHTESYPWSMFKWYEELESSIILRSDNNGCFLIPIEKQSDLRKKIIDVLNIKYKPVPT